jgi:Tol biopolymer transport system component
MSLQPGTRLGRYDIVSPLGAGGMGEVYRARDTSLHRDVAIKVLPHGTADDPHARERLTREARSLSRLSHPHICAVHDVGDDAGRMFIVMELLDGETLAARIARGPLGSSDTLRLGCEIAEALGAAHRQGIVHRDLKPGNVMLTPGGVKLLDFGLAKDAAPDPESAATRGRSLTGEGTVLGTLQYMSPEQMEGKPADARSDIFALGTVLYEMATGRRAFSGDSATGLAAAVLTADPPPLAGAPVLDRIVRGCIAKDPERRWQSAQDVALQLATSGESLAAAAGPPPRRMPAWIPWAAAVLAAGVAIAAVAVRPAPQAGAAPSPVAFTVAPPQGLTFRTSVERTPFAVSPDGTVVAFVAGSQEAGWKIFLRPLAAVDAKPLAGTEGAESLFWSPDGRSIGFFAAGKLRQVASAGGAPVTICPVREEVGLTGSWGADDQIIFASVEGEAIFRVSTSGGTPTADVKPDPSHGDARLVWPAFLPDGRRYLYTVTRRDDTAEVRLADPGRPPRTLLKARSSARYMDPGYLLFVEDSALLARRFDAASGRVTGESIPLADEVAYFRATAVAHFTASSSGVLAYSSGSDLSRLAWFDRTGHEMGEVRPPDAYLNLRISSDGREVLFDRLAKRTRHFDLYSLDLSRGLETRLTTSPFTEVNPQFGPPGTLIYTSSHGSAPRLTRRVLATGVDELIVPDAQSMQLASDVSADKKWLLYSERADRGNFDVHALPLDGGAPVPMATTAFNETQPSFSPDGRFIAFTSDETGRREVYVAPFASPRAKRLVSSAGGVSPRWDRVHRELVYLTPGQEVMSVPVDTSASLEIGTPKVLFKRPKDAGWGAYDIAPDGRFLAVVPVQSTGQQPLTVIVNRSATLPR